MDASLPGLIDEVRRGGQSHDRSCGAVPWWFLGYVINQVPKGATMVTVIGPFHTEVQAVDRRVEWLAISQAHQATTVWYTRHDA